MKKNPENLPFALSGRSVPLGFNLPRNRFPLPIACRSDCTSVQVWFYECRGCYWYSVTIASCSAINSVGFLSLQGAITEFRAFLRGHGFAFEDTSLAECRLRGIRRSVVPPRSSEV